MAASRLSLTKLLRTSSFRLTMLYAGMFMASVLVLFGVIYWWAADYAFKDETDDINAEYIAIQDEMRLAGPDKLSEIVANHIRQHADESAVYLVLDAGGRKMAGNLPEMAPGAGDLMLRTGGGHEEPAHWYRLNDGKYLLIGQDPQSLREMKLLIARAFTISLILTVLLAVGGGVVIAGSVLHRVDTVGRTSQAIAGGDLSQRVPVSGSEDEFDTLALGINAMLDRIEDLMSSMRQVSNDIAHDLRTPLTRMRQRLEASLDPQADEARLRDDIQHALSEVDGLLATFRALLRIANVESRQRQSGFEDLDLSEVFDTLAETYRPVAEDLGQHLSARIESGRHLRGDRILLTQMLANLIENALHHTPPGSRIELSLQGSSGRVTDTGPGIPAEARERVLRRFVRLDSSRSTPGSGLGLALVAAVADLHGIRLVLGDAMPGLVVELGFPAA